MNATIRRRMDEMRQRWTPAQKKQRQEISRRRCAALLEQLEATQGLQSNLWAGGAMTVSDLARIAG